MNREETRRKLEEIVSQGLVVGIGINDAYWPDPLTLTQRTHIPSLRE